MIGQPVAEEMIVVGRHRTIREHVTEIWRYRELLVGLTRKELKVRYKDSVLGFVWSMIQPVFLLAVYAVVFSILGAGFARFPIWLLCGLVLWNFVSTCLATSVQSITANAYLVSKVRFPRAVLPLSNVSAALVHLGLQLVALSIVLAVSRHGVAWDYVWLLVPAIITITTLCSALSVMLAALNVKARDTQHLLDLAMLAWFWLTPIIYEYARGASGIDGKGLPAGLMLINPITPVVICFQRALYGRSFVDQTLLLPDNGPLWYLRNVAIVFVVSVGLLCVALRAFDRAEANFAEDL